MTSLRTCFYFNIDENIGLCLLKCTFMITNTQSYFFLLFLLNLIDALSIFIHTFIRSFIHSSFIHSLIHSSIVRSVVRSFGRSVVRSFVLPNFLYPTFYFICRLTFFGFRAICMYNLFYILF
jgi:hypothetical protein